MKIFQTRKTCLSVFVLIIGKFFILQNIYIATASSDGGLNINHNRSGLKLFFIIKRTSEKEPVQGILFDLDGTLAETDTYHYESYRDVILKQVPKFNSGYPISREFFNLEISGKNNQEIVPRLFPTLPFSKQKALWEAKEQLYREVSLQMSPIEGLLEFIDKCESRKIKMIVVTNSPRREAAHTLQILGLTKRFWNDIVIGSECQAVKPHPAPYLEGLKRLNLQANDCLAFEDSIGGCQSACAAQIKTVGVCTTWSSEQLMGLGCVSTIQTFSDQALWERVFY